MKKTAQIVSDLRLRYRGHHRWVTTEPLVVRYDGRRFIVPAGFATDLDSVPRIPGVHALLKNHAFIASTVHDYTYRCGMDRQLSDSLFYHTMLAEGVPRWKACLLWLGVRIGGWAFYLGRRR